MPSLKTILVVDDNVVNRAIMAKILTKEYNVLEASNGQMALALLSEHSDEIVAMMLDIVMPVMDGYAVLEALAGDERYINLPIIVMTENNDSESEIKALSLGAWDFVSKPYHPQIIYFRLKNVIDRSQLSALKRLEYLADYDVLTGIYNKTKFFEATHTMLNEHREQRFVFIRFDVDRFQLINSFFGTAEGDKLLIYLAEKLALGTTKFTNVTYGRIESDIFGCCLPYNPATLEYTVRRAKETLVAYNPNYDIVPSVGLYVIDNDITVEEMYNRATLAAKSCKGNYVDYFAYYNEQMSIELTREQEVVNEMNIALEKGQFQIYLQPQYNIHTNAPCGAEALVRWVHPEKGVLMPSEFLSVFERNGFITKMDHYVWEQTCQCLRSWLDQGLMVSPVSVNVSRVNLYNPRLAENLLELVESYGLKPALLQLELTESAYTDNPIAMRKTMSQLKDYGFIIMMDDFGSGYSSLSLLKDIEVDVLKIDMRFLSATAIPGRGENIIASVIRMAKWLNIPVIAEGAETSEQVDFLRSVGCDYVQGYFFAHPVPVQEYERQYLHQIADVAIITDSKYGNYNYDELFSFNPHMKLLFNNVLQAAAIYEFVDERIEMIRVNEAYYALLGHDDMLVRTPDILSLVEEECRETLLTAFRTCALTQEIVECEYLRRRPNGAALWIHTKLHYVFTAGDKQVIIGELIDITMRKTIDFEIQKYKSTLLANNYQANTVLIVDDAEINRMVLKKILHDQFLFLEAENGEDAIEILQQQRDNIDLILLDITMPKMDGKEFLQYKKKRIEYDGIPVIMITADDSPEQQISTLALGANDYIVKPFIPEVVLRRVKNVLESNYRFKEMVREYNNMSEQVKTDLMTGLLNRISAELMITKHLENTTGLCAMLMLDIDNFKKFNDTLGHAYGDKVIIGVADKLRENFRQDDIVVRMGGDEFAVFMENIPNLAVAEMKAQQLRNSMSEIEIDGNKGIITCSVGIALSSDLTHSFELLYQNADKALYSAKCSGRNAVSIYGDEPTVTSETEWISDVRGILDTINDGIYAFNKSTYDLLYLNQHLCEYLDIPSDKWQGGKCYEVLMHQTAPCEFCQLAKMTENNVYSRLFRIPNSEQLFLLRGKDINKKGTMIHFEVAVDITKISNLNLHMEDIIDGAE